MKPSGNENIVRLAFRHIGISFKNSLSGIKETHRSLRSRRSLVHCRSLVHRRGLVHRRSLGHRSLARRTPGRRGRASPSSWPLQLAPGQRWLSLLRSAWRREHFDIN